MRTIKFALQFMLLLAVVAVFGGFAALRFPAYSRLVQEENRLKAELSAKQKEAEAIQRDIDSAGTDAFVEKMARERLNMIHADEFIFIIDY